MSTAVHFLVVGAGGLGCPALLGLLAGGARRITIVDDDRVDLSNLPRQVLYARADVGMTKVDAARASLLARSPIEATPQITTLTRRLLPDELDTFLGALAPGDPWVVLECSDSPALKFATHDACFARAIPAVIGGVVRWQGQAMAVDPRRAQSACYRCLFEAPPPRELAPACASVGVAGPAAGTVGHAMACLALGLAENHEQDGVRPVAGVCLHFDLLRGHVRELAPRPRPDCSICGHRATEMIEPQPCNIGRGPA